MGDKSPEIKKEDEEKVEEESDMKEGAHGSEQKPEEAEPEPEAAKKEDTIDKKEDKKEDKKNDKKEQELRKKKYANWPMHDIKDPHPNDVLYGRGGGTNHHPGNKIYRKTVEDRKLDYVNSKRLDKPLVALEIIREWRGQDPPGRFLKLDEKTGHWHDVGDKKAREKTSQALREKAPEIRKKQEDDAMGQPGAKDPSAVKEKDKKATRFADGTKDQQRDQVRHALLARDHSLGREYIGAGDTVALDGFSWDPASIDRIPSYTSALGPYPPGRVTSYGSHGIMPPPFPPSRAGSHASISGGPPMPPPGEYYRTMSQEQRQQSLGSGRYDGWSRMPSGGNVLPPPMPPYGGSPYQQHRSGSFGAMGMPMSRDHSLSNNPLSNASISHPVNQSAFDGRNGSGYWGAPNMPPPPPHGMPSPVYGGPRYSSGGPPQFARTPSYDPNQPPLPVSPPPPPSVKPTAAPPPAAGRAYNVDPVIAKSWSTQSEDFEMAATMFSGHGGQGLNRSWSGDSGGGNDRQQSVPGSFPDRRDDGGVMPRPDIVKRMTSNQNEDFETKRDYVGEGRSIKRAALNRDNSTAANRLKEEYPPGGGLKKPMKIDNEMRSLSVSMEQSSLGARPKPLSLEERTSTIDMMTMELMVKPNPLNVSARSSTIDQLNLDLDDVEYVGLNDEAPKLPKPPALRTEGRLSTAEYLDIVNEPLGDDDVETRPLNLNRETLVSEWLSQG